MKESPKRDIHVSVVGAGIVGLCTALRLRTDGYRVTLFDPREPGTATSFGNAGSISASALMPYSTPGLWRRLPWMLANEMSPLRLPWQHLGRSLPWIARFLLAGSNRQKIEHHAEAMAGLMQRTVPGHRDLMRRHNIDPQLVKPVGWLSVFRDSAAIDGEAFALSLLDKHEIEVDVVNADEIRQMEPGLSHEFQCGIFNKHDAFAVQPIALSTAYYRAFIAAGGEIRHESVRGFEMGSDGPTKMVTDLGIHPVDNLVIAAGAWSRDLAKQLGLFIPVEAERGYHVNIPWSDEVTLNRPVFVADGYYVLCPMNDGVRVTSGAEFGGVKLPPDFRRIRRVLNEARQSLNGLNGEVNREWMGWRPSLPDSRPVIARSPHFRQVLFAFGHGHLGLTLSAVTSEIISDLIADRTPALPIEGFQADRFASVVGH